MTTTNNLEEARTNQQWWEEKAYYNSEAAPNARVGQLFERFLPKRSDWSVIEIGACPGNNLLTLARSHGYHPVALDFLPAVRHMPAVFRKHGIENLEVMQDDFFSLPEDRRFNVVMSFGFIEHFNDAEAVLRKHWALVADDGFLVLSLPIFGPMQLALQRLIFTPEKLAESLQAHNTSIMDMRLFRKWSGRLPGAVIVECGYLGHMGTWIYSSDPFVRRDRRWILWGWKIASVAPRTLRVSCRLFSPYGLLVLRRQSAAGMNAGKPIREVLDSK
jgi:2-polyprenyl-3-methyl-5-hydroxy-6-metoxy-1,4-benzoquinol methylase